MKALSLWQPWASLIAVGAKRIETRDWSTRYRGPLAIHAAKCFAQAERAMCLEPAFAAALSGAGYRRLREIPLGAVVATCMLVDCIEIPEGTPREGLLFGEGKLVRGVKLPPDEPELLFGNYTPGRFAWVLAEVTRFRVPMPYKGAQGLFQIDIDELKRGLAQ